MGENLHVCGYERCGRAFATPVRLTDFSNGSRSETYFACPYCFSKITESEAVEHVHDGGFEAPAQEGVKKGGDHKKSSEVEPAEGCPRKLGYLKARSREESIPDVCLTCPRILQCMV